MLAGVLACLMHCVPTYYCVILCFPLCLLGGLTIVQCSGNVVECTGRKAKASAHPLTITTTGSCRWHCCHFCHLCHLLRMRPLSPNATSIWIALQILQLLPPSMLLQLPSVAVKTLPSSFESAPACPLHPCCSCKVLLSSKVLCYTLL